MRHTSSPCSNIPLHLTYLGFLLQKQWKRILLLDRTTPPEDVYLTIQNYTTSRSQLLPCTHAMNTERVPLTAEVWELISNCSIQSCTQTHKDLYCCVKPPSLPEEEAETCRTASKVGIWFLYISMNTKLHEEILSLQHLFLNSGIWQFNYSPEASS